MRILTAIFLISTAALAQPPAPDTLYIHGNILTGSHLKPDDRSATPARVTAIAISHGAITAVGTDAAILKLKSPQTKVIDLQGAFAMPGFNDAHTHLAAAGRQKLTVDLDGANLLADMLARIRTYAATASPGSWLEGSGWDHTKWPSKTLPTRTDLDAVTGSHPAMFTRVDGHIVVANSAALAAANISASTPDPAGGKIDRDSSGNPTGIVREGPAIALLTAKIPPPSLDDRHRALDIAIADSFPTASPAFRTSPTGTTSSSCSPSNTKTNSTFASPSGSTSTSHSPSSKSAAPATIPTTRSSTSAC